MFFGRLQSLYDALGDTSDEYARQRTAKVKAITKYIRPYLKRSVNAAAYAEELMSSAEEMGHIYGDTVNCEIAGRYAKSGNPLAFTI